MRILKSNVDIFRMPNSINSAVCVTTNGMVKRDGHAVMGAGIAKQADKMFNLSTDLGEKLRKNGNHVFYMGTITAYAKFYSLFTFPTKHDWRNNSDLLLIAQSAKELVAYCNRLNIHTCYLPPVGCGLGGLDWNTQVQPVLEPILDDRFTIVIRP